jgi:hypothetical protein
LRQLYAQPGGSFAGLLGGLSGAGEQVLSGGATSLPRPTGAPAKANAPTYRPGQTLKLGDGSTATVSGVNPDGSLQVQ